MSDPFVHFDGAYLLGALSDAERDAFEEHLITCDACRARVDEIAAVPALLAGLTAADFKTVPEPMPDTLLPGLLRAAEASRRRARVLVSGLGAVAAACIAALAVVLWPASSSPAGSAQAMRAVIPGAPVHASVRFIAKDWGTEIDMYCAYSANMSTRSMPYELVVYDQAQHEQSIGSWSLKPGQHEEFRVPTSVQLDDISRLELQLPNDQPVLALER